MSDLFPALGVAVTALGGAAIGLERQWSGHATGAHPHLGGIHTFTLIGGAAGLAGLLASSGYNAVAVALGSAQGYPWAGVLGGLTLGTRTFGWFTTATLASMIVALGVAMVIVR